MKKIISNLKRQVANAKKYKNGMDEASWGYEQGVLITPNEALAIIEALNQVNKISSNVLVSGSLLADIRQAVADYTGSEGCSCCSNYEQHKEDKARLGKLLKVKKYSDGSGYDFTKYRSKQ